jgi:pimeloyl-ACP methyl ester carboxylesterase
MARHPIALVAALLATLLAVGCSGPGQVLRPSDGAARSETAPKPALSGEPGALRSIAGCVGATTFYRPSPPRTDGLAVLAPGFLRDRIGLRDLARALADRGIPTVTLTPCHSPWDGRQVQTAADMQRLARRLGGRRILYGGFSAGALSALIAARSDPRAVGVLALDLVDRRGLGILLAKGLKVPLIGLSGEPGPCNARNNGLAVFAAAPKSRLLSIRGASHCDFESPTDRLCEIFCTDPDLRSGSESRRQEILARSVDAAADLLAVPMDRASGAVRGSRQVGRVADPDRDARSGSRAAPGSPSRLSAEADSARSDRPALRRSDRISSLSILSKIIGRRSDCQTSEVRR